MNETTKVEKETDATAVTEHANPLMVRGLDGIQQGQEYVRLRGNGQKRV